MILIMVKGHSKRAKEIYIYIVEFYAENLRTPSFREICKQFGYASVSSVSFYINMLRDKKLLVNEDGGTNYRLALYDEKLKNYFKELIKDDVLYTTDIEFKDLPDGGDTDEG